MIPAATEDVITAENADKVRARIIVEGANGPTSSEADTLLKAKNILVVPDILSNAGGVIVSYFEWLQNNKNESWRIDQVNARLETILQQAFNEVFETADEYYITPRIAAYVIALKRVSVGMKLKFQK